MLNKCAAAPQLPEAPWEQLLGGLSQWPLCLGPEMRCRDWPGAQLIQGPSFILSEKISLDFQSKFSRKMLMNFNKNSFTGLVAAPAPHRKACESERAGSCRARRA